MVHLLQSRLNTMGKLLYLYLVIIFASSTTSWADSAFSGQVIENNQYREVRIERGGRTPLDFMLVLGGKKFTGIFLEQACIFQSSDRDWNISIHFGPDFRKILELPIANGAKCSESAIGILLSRQESRGSSSKFELLCIQPID